MKITVSSLDQIDYVVATDQPSHMITLIDPATHVSTPHVIDRKKHLRIDCHDIPAPRDNLIHPTEEHVRTVIDFLGQWEMEAPMLIHCFMGISRSSAAAYIALCLHNEGREMEAAYHLRSEGAHAQPNPLIIAHADRILARDGQMIAAVEKIGAADLSTMGMPFTVSMDLRPVDSD